MIHALAEPWPCFLVAGKGAVLTRGINGIAADRHLVRARAEVRRCNVQCGVIHSFTVLVRTNTATDAQWHENVFACKLQDL